MTAGEILAKMVKGEGNREKLEEEFVEASRRQLGDYCTEFSIEKKNMENK